MMHPFLLLIVGCAPLSADCSNSTETSSAPPDCAEAEALAASTQAGVDSLAADRDRAWFAAQTMVEMQGMAVRAGNEPLSAAAREAYILDFEQHRSELEIAGASDPALHPDTLGLSDSRLDYESYAWGAVGDLDDALDSTIAHIADFEREISASERAAEQALAPYPDCALTVEATDRDPIDRDSLPDAARGTNLDEGLDLAATARASNDQALDLLNRIRRLAITAASGTTGDATRAALQAEYEGLAWELERIADTTRYNGHPLSDGSHVTAVVFLDVGRGGTIDITLGDLSPIVLGVDTGALDLTTATGAAAAIDGVDTALWTVENYTVYLDVASSTLTVERERLVAP